jgi:hypothetical protein
MIRFLTTTLMLSAMALFGCSKQSTPAAQQGKASKAAGPQTKAAKPAPKKALVKAKPKAAKPTAEAQSAAVTPQTDSTPKGTAANQALKAAPVGSKKADSQKADPGKSGKPVVSTGTPLKGLAGVWLIDTDAFAKLPEFKSQTEEQRQRALKMLKKTTLQMTFGASNIAINGMMLGKKQADLVNFKLIKSEGGVHTISTLVSGKEKTQMLAPKGDQLTITTGDMKMMFKRQAAKKP